MEPTHRNTDNDPGTGNNFDSTGILETPRILVVEDSLTQAQHLKHILQEANFLVDLVSNGTPALEYLENTIPTIIISDVLMPGMSGFQLCSKIKLDHRFSYIPVMLLTSLADPEDIIHGLESGADNFITKPFQKEYLLSQVDYMIANARIRKFSRVHHSEMPNMGMEIFFGGKKHYIQSSQLQILDLLFSTFDAYVQKNIELEEKNRRLSDKFERIKTLQGLIPICSNCKKIRDDDGYWQQVEFYLSTHSDADFNMSICPQCLIKDLKK